MQRIAFGAAAAVLTAGALFGIGSAQADADEDLKYWVCSKLDAGDNAVLIAKVLLEGGYSVRQAADIVHDAVMDHCIEHHHDVWPA